ncbi:MAG: glycosyltransferase family 4 protein [Cyclobacteriaceae bacterium]|nr:glycosyltransferase family 4 protein [Cyclobacteriaceae bacterium]
MKIHIDNQIFRLQRYGGISRYYIRLAEELHQLGHQVNILGGFHINAYLRDADPAIGFGKYYQKYPKHSIRVLREVGRLINQWHHFISGSDIIHETYFMDKPPIRGKQPRVITEYDCMHEIFPDLFTSNEIKTEEKRKAFERADLILAISHQTKRDLCEYFSLSEDKIRVTHLAADPKFPKELIIQPKHSQRPFFLYVGIRLLHKNFVGMLQGFAKSEALMKDFDLLVFSPTPFSGKEKEIINNLGFKSNQVRWDSGDDSKLYGYYQQAHAFVYPSLYEGFGIPPLEAMTYGCPVVCSNSSSLPEVVGDAALTFDPLEPEEMMVQLEKVAYQDSVRNCLIERGYARNNQFSWKKTAEETLAVYQELL